MEAEHHHTTAAEDASRLERYASRALDGACEDVGSRSVGMRRTTLWSKAAHLGALFAATGERVRRLPITTAGFRAA